MNRQELGEKKFYPQMLVEPRTAAEHVGSGRRRGQSSCGGGMRLGRFGRRPPEGRRWRRRVAGSSAGVGEGEGEPGEMGIAVECELETTATLRERD